MLHMGAQKSGSAQQCVTCARATASETLFDLGLSYYFTPVIVLCTSKQHKGEWCKPGLKAISLMLHSQPQKTNKEGVEDISSTLHDMGKSGNQERNWLMAKHPNVVCCKARVPFTGLAAKP